METLGGLIVRDPELIEQLESIVKEIPSDE
jgi:hypothetical protein